MLIMACLTRNCSEATQLVHNICVKQSGEVCSLTLQAVERLVGRVDELAACVQRVTFDIFDKANGAEWRNVKAAFDARNELVGGVTKELINTSFRCGPMAHLAFSPSPCLQDLILSVLQIRPGPCVHADA